MVIPEKIKIGSSIYNVILTKDKLEVDGNECFGYIDYNFHKIFLNEEIQDRQGLEQTFLHEILHGIFNEIGLQDKSEDEVDRISIGLLQVIRDNPYLFSILQISSNEVCEK